jgi:hypothetical protein
MAASDAFAAYVREIAEDDDLVHCTNEAWKAQGASDDVFETLLQTLRTYTGLRQRRVACIAVRGRVVHDWVPRLFRALYAATPEDVARVLLSTNSAGRDALVLDWLLPKMALDEVRSDRYLNAILISMASDTTHGSVLAPIKPGAAALFRALVCDGFASGRAQKVFIEALFRAAVARRAASAVAELLRLLELVPSLKPATLDAARTSAIKQSVTAGDSALLRALHPTVAELSYRDEEGRSAWFDLCDGVVRADSYDGRFEVMSARLKSAGIPNKADDSGQSSCTYLVNEIAAHHFRHHLRDESVLAAVFSLLPPTDD